MNCQEKSKCECIKECLWLNLLTPWFYRGFSKSWNVLTWNQSPLWQEWNGAFYSKCKQWLVNHNWMCVDSCPDWYKLNDNGKCVPLSSI